MTRQSEGIGLVKGTQVSKLGIRFVSIGQEKTFFVQQLADLHELLVGQPVKHFSSDRLRRKYLAQVHQRMTSDRKRHSRLVFAHLLCADHRERTDIQDRSQRTEPRLVVMLRTEIG